MRLPACDLEYDLLAGCIGDSPVRRSSLRACRDYADIRYGILYLIDSGKVGQDPPYKLHIHQRGSIPGTVIGFILSISGKEKQSGGKSGFVKPFRNETVLHDRYAGITESGSIDQTVLAGRRYGCDRVVSRNDDVPAFKIASSPLAGTRKYGASIL